MERRAAPGPFFLIKRVITMQILALCWLTFSLRPGSENTRSNVFTRYKLFNSMEGESYEPVWWIKRVIKFSMREWWSFGLPPLDLLPTWPSTHSFSLMRCAGCLSLSSLVSLLLFVCFHCLFPFSPHSSLISFSLCVRPSTNHSVSLLNQRASEARFDVCTEDNSRGAQVCEMQGTET